MGWKDDCIKKYLIPFGICLVLGLTGCDKEVTQDTELLEVKIPEYQKNSYSTATVKKGTIQPVLSLSLKPDEYEVITYSVMKESMLVSKLNIEKGQRVRAGDVMVEFKNDDIAGKLKEYQARKEETQMLIEHYKKLQKIEGKKKYADDLKKLQEELVIVDLYIKEQQDLLKSYQLIAQKDGVVTELSNDLYLGFAKMGVAVIKVASGSSCYMASTSDPYEFKEGDVYQTSLGTVNYDMKVASVMQDGESKNILFEPVTALEGITPADVLTLTIEKEPYENALYVEKEAVLYMDDKAYVFTLDENGFREVVEVQVEDIVDGYAILKGGITQGEQVTLY